MVDRTETEVREIDVAQLSEDALRDLAAMHTAIERESDPDVPAWSLAWTAGMYPRSLSTVQDHVSLLAFADDRPVGRALIELNNEANAHILEMDIGVHPEMRRRGIGTALVRRAVDIARRHERTDVVSWAVKSDAASRFWAARGFESAYVERSNQLRMAEVDWDRMAGWVAAAQPARDAGFRLEFWNAIPDDRISDIVEVSAGMFDAPLDDLALAHTTSTDQSIREWSQRWRSMGSNRWMMLVYAPDGSPAAYTGIMIHKTRPHLGSQRSTTTLPQYRNQGLGRWIKAAMVQRLAADCPELVLIETDNAESNRPMLRLNEEMGFVPAARFEAFQAEVGDIQPSMFRG